nr:hypothetical protein [Tanacetum cinerariifolium]
NEAIHLLLTKIGDEIYSTVDACKTTHDMWIAIKRLQQGESLNKHDEFRHFAKECRKPKREKDYAYHKEKMFLCKQAEKGFDAEPLEKVQYDAEYNVFANERQHSEQPESINDTYVVETVDSNVIFDSSDKCDNDNQADQNAEECDDERAVLANLITNLNLIRMKEKKIQN